MIQTGRYTVLPRGIMDVCVRAPRTAAAGNGLLNNLIAYWPGNEANGDLLDVHGIYPLTAYNAPTSDTGKVYTTARKYLYASKQYHLKFYDDLITGTARGSFTVALWVYEYSHVANAGFAAQWFGTTRNWTLCWSPGGYYYFITSASDWIGTPYNPAVGVWHLVIVWYDRLAGGTWGTIGLQVDNGIPQTKAVKSWGGANSPFCVGVAYSGAYTLNGKLGPTAFWSSPGVDTTGALTSNQREALWNEGAGLPYASFTV